MSEQIITKRCHRCKKIKPISEFSKDCCEKSGHQVYCKMCQKVYGQSRKGKASKKRYKQTEKGKLAEKRYRQTEKRKDSQKRYNQTKKGKASRKRAVLKNQAKFPQRHKARLAVTHAIVTGNMVHPSTLKCHYCSTQAKEYHHHKGYAPEHWLDVIPVCKKCHDNVRSHYIVDNVLFLPPL